MFSHVYNQLGIENALRQNVAPRGANGKTLRSLMPQYALLL